MYLYTVWGKMPVWAGCPVSGVYDKQTTSNTQSFMDRIEHAIAKHVARCQLK